MSVIRNLVLIYKKDKEVDEAMKDIVVDTASAAAVSYTTGFSGTVIKGAAQNSSSDLLKGMSRTNLPAYIAIATLEAGKTLKSFFDGEIDGVQCLEQLGEKGYGLINSALYAAIGQIAIPIPIVGALAGSMIGYALSSMSYNILTTSLKDAKVAHERRLSIEAECEEAIQMINEYKDELELFIKAQKEQYNFITQMFNEIDIAIQAGDVDSYIAATNRITKELGGTVLFTNRQEFEELMANDSAIIL